MIFHAKFDINVNTCEIWKLYEMTKCCVSYICS